MTEVEQMAAKDLNLAELWVLADKLGIPILQNLAIRSMIDIGKDFSPAVQTFNFIYENTAPHSHLRLLAVYQCAHQISSYRIKCNPEYFPKELLQELAIYFVGNSRQDELQIPSAEHFFVAVDERG